MKNRKILMMASVLSICITSACSKPAEQIGTDAAPVNPITSMPTDPINLTFFMGGAITDQEFQTLVADPIKKKYPNITAERVKGTLDQMITSNMIPDVIGVSPFSWLPQLQELGLLTDLNPLIKKYNIDLSVVDPLVMQALNGMSKKGMYALPHRVNSYALYYNKDIFDKFGVAYPKNGMTWPQVTELAAKVTRMEGGVQYRGLDINRIHNFGSPYSLPYIDPNTNKSVFPEKWKTVFETAMAIYSIPNNNPGKSVQTQLVIGNPNSGLAMTPGYTEAIYRLIEGQKTTGMRWGVVQYPSFPDLPNMNKQLVVESFLFPPQGKNLDVAFRAVSHLLSDEVQMENAKNAMVSVLKDTKYVKEFGKNVPELKDQDLSGIFMGKYATPAPIHKYDQIVTNALFKAFDDVIAGTTDINTALKSAKEKADQEIAALN